jgi:DNA-binding response OmpR family regulator
MATVPLQSDNPETLLGRVLVLDDDPLMRNTITTFLGRHNADAVGIGEASGIMQQIERGGFSLLVLDVQLGSQDGFEVLRQIRERSNIPIIIITGQRQDEIDRIVGLELGADDYLAKPFSLHELLARARATLRRQAAGRQDARLPSERGGFRFGGWELRRRTRALTNPQGAEVPLTRREYALLLTFLEAPGRVLTREHLLSLTRSHDDVFDRSMDVQVLRLRRKLESDPANPSFIRTERGVGYRFDALVEPFF